MPTTKTMLGVGACAIAVVALCRRALRTPTPRDGRPQLTRQNAYRTLPGLRDDPPPSYEAATAPKDLVGGAPPKPEGDCATPAFALELLKALSSTRENVFVSPLSIATALKMALAGATPGSRHVESSSAAPTSFITPESVPPVKIADSALAAWLLRCWQSASNTEGPIDRMALASHPGLGFFNGAELIDAAVLEEVVKIERLSLATEVILFEQKSKELTKG